MFCLLGCFHPTSRQPKGSSWFTAPLVLLFSHCHVVPFSCLSPLPSFSSLFIPLTCLPHQLTPSPSSFTYSSFCRFCLFLLFLVLVLLLLFLFLFLPFCFCLSPSLLFLFHFCFPLFSSLLFSAFLLFSPFLLSLSSPSLSLPLLSSPASLSSQTSACTRGPTTARPSTHSRLSAPTPPTTTRVAASPSSAQRPTLAPLLH